MNVTLKSKLPRLLAYSDEFPMNRNPILNAYERDEFERKLDDNGKRLKGIEMELIDTKAALSSTLQNMGQRLETKI